MNKTYLLLIKPWLAVCAQPSLSTGMRSLLLIACWLILLAVGVAINVPSSYAQVQAEPGSAMTPTKGDSININTADAQTLANKLKGVGEARAGDIVRYREIYGPFVSADELAEVKGIGQSTIDRNRDVITLE